MKRKYLALAAIPAALAVYSLAPGSASAHNANAGCVGPAAFFSVDSYPSGSTYQLDGGAVTSFSGGFSKTLPGEVAHSLSLVTGDGLTQFNRTLTTPICVVTTTTGATTSTTTSTTVPGSSSTLPQTSTTSESTTSPPTTVADSTTLPSSTAPSTTAPPRVVSISGFCLGEKPGNLADGNAYFQAFNYPDNSEYQMDGGGFVSFSGTIDLVRPGTSPHTFEARFPGDARLDRSVTTPVCPQPPIVTPPTQPTTTVVPDDVCLDINPATGIGVTNIHFLPCGPGLPPCSDASQQIVPPTDGSCDTTTVAPAPPTTLTTHLPVTGSNTGTLAAIAAGLVGLGGLILLARRRPA